MSRLFMTRVIAVSVSVLLCPGPAVAQNRRVSDPPSDRDPSESSLRTKRIFSEPLVPVGSHPTMEENRRLAEALRQYEQRTIADDFSALEKFIDENPNSPWRAS